MQQFKTIFIFFILVGFAFSQSYLGKQRSFDMDENKMMKLLKGEPSLESLSSYFFSKSYDDILEEATSAGINLTENDDTIYIEKDKVRFDKFDKEEGEISAIINFKTNIVLTILYEKEEYVEMDLNQIKQLKKQMASGIHDFTSQLKGINLPPEAKAKLEQMMGTGKKTEPTVKATGNSKMINDFKCLEYQVSKENKIEQVWVTLKYPELRKYFEKVSIVMAMGDDNYPSAIWKNIESGWPVSQIDIEFNQMLMKVQINVNEIYSMEETTHKDGTFDPPAGFKKTTMEEQMQDAMKGFQMK